MKNTSINVVENFGVTRAELTKLISVLSKGDVDDADIFLQAFDDEYWLLEDGVIKDLSLVRNKGAGLRCIKGDTTGYSYSEDFHFNSLLKAADAARTISAPIIAKPALTVSNMKKKYYGDNHPLYGICDDSKAAYLHKIEACARGLSEKVDKVSVSISSRYEEVLVFGLDNKIVTDVRPLFRINLSVVCASGNERYSGSSSFGGRYELATIDKDEMALNIANEAVHLALIQFEAKPAPAGEMTVVLGSGWPGVLLHEAVGHGLEGDFNRKGVSAFSGRIGEKVASSECTVVDDGTIQGKRGSINIDDEGTPGQRTTLIEKGVLKGYMHDKLSARMMGTDPTGNGRRESYEYSPMPRMTNTFMEPGKYGRSEIIESVPLGVYAANFSGGQVDITSGKFVFSANEAYMIRDGKLAEPIKGATIIGDGPSVMHQISMVGNDFALDNGIGVCGKDGQSVMVGVGQPTLKINKITVGGTETNA